MFPELKLYINAIVFSPTLLLLGIVLGIWLFGKRFKLGKLVAISSTALLWIFATPAFSIWLSHSLLTQYQPTTAEFIQTKGIQAIVVLGGGVNSGQPDGIQQLTPSALDRLRYGIELSRQTGIPMLITGGKGWGAVAESESEAIISKRVALQAFQFEVKWTESDSRDTRENAANSKKLLSNQGFNKIALVTHSWHMPRSMKAFQHAGFEVTPAPMGFVSGNNWELMTLIPQSSALSATFTIFREFVALSVQGQ